MKILAAAALLAVPAFAADTDLSHGPTPLRANTWAHEYDYPDEVEGTDRQAARLLLVVDTHGYVRRCDILESGGAPLHDVRGCAVLTQRARFNAAVDKNGKAIQSSVAFTVDWRKPFASGGPFAPPVDFVVDVAHLPDNRALASVSVRQILSDQGTLEHCDVESPSGLAAIDNQACTLATPLLKLGPVLGLGNKPIRAMRISRLVIERTG